MSLKISEPLTIKITNAVFKIIEKVSRKRLLFLIFEGYILNPFIRNMFNGIATKIEKEKLEKPEELLKITFGEDNYKSKKAATSEFFFAIIDKYKEKIQR
ncbi:MAG: hypothetical protein ACTSRG_09290 [Candidatus Helarchaeota archaeon]